MSQMKGLKELNAAGQAAMVRGYGKNMNEFFNRFCHIRFCNYIANN